MSITYIEQAPRGRIGSIIEKLWLLEDHRSIGDEPFARLIPDGRIELIIEIDGTHRVGKRKADAKFCSGALFGQMSTFLDVRRKCPRCVVGVRFRAVGASSLLQLPLGLLSGQVTEFEALRTGVDPYIAERLSAIIDNKTKLTFLEKLLDAQLRPPPVSDVGIVHHVVDTIQRKGGYQTIRQLSAEVGIGSRRLERLFYAEVGLSPKQYSRLVRFRCALHLLRSNSHAGVGAALDSGYFDQSHFIHEFRSFTGYSPMEYLAARTVHEH